MAVLFKKDQLYRQLRTDILSGKYPDGFVLPPGVEFARQLGVGKVTLWAALDSLENEMLVKRVKGRGTYVNYRPEKTVTRSVLMLTGKNYMTIPNNTCLRMFPRFHRQALEHNFNEIFFTEEELLQMTAAEFRQMITNANIAGILVFSHVFDGNEPWLLTLQQSGVPVILTFALREDYEITKCAAITFKMRESMRDALRYLAGRGHKTLGVIGTKTIYNDRMLEFTPRELHMEIDGYGMNCPEDMIFFCQPERGIIAEVVKRWLRAEAPPEVILIEGNMQPALYGVLEECGLRIPDDIKVLVFGDKNNIIAEPRPIVFDCDYDGIAAKSYQLLLEADKWYPHSPPNRYHNYLLAE